MSAGTVVFVTKFWLGIFFVRTPSDSAQRCACSSLSRAHASFVLKRVLRPLQRVSAALSSCLASEVELTRPVRGYCRAFVFCESLSSLGECPLNLLPLLFCLRPLGSRRESDFFASGQRRPSIGNHPLNSVFFFPSLPSFPVPLQK